MEYASVGIDRKVFGSVSSVLGLDFKIIFGDFKVYGLKQTENATL